MADSTEPGTTNPTRSVTMISNTWSIGVSSRRRMSPSCLVVGRLYWSGADEQYLGRGPILPYIFRTELLAPDWAGCSCRCRVLGQHSRTYSLCGKQDFAPSFAWPPPSHLWGLGRGVKVATGAMPGLPSGCLPTALGGSLGQMKG